MEDMKFHHSLCSCYSSQHTVHWQHDQVDNEVYFDVSLTWNKSFLRRVKNAIKYIFGHRSVYGHFDCFILSKDEAKKLVEFLNKYIAEGIPQ